MGIRFTVLSSGSTGNATLVEYGDRKILLDAGLSMKRIEQLLAEKGVSGDQLSCMFVTHEHSDHIKGIGALARKYALPVYANAKTWNELDRLCGDVAMEQRMIFKTGDEIMIGDLRVESFPISHDAAEPVAYNFHAEGFKLSVATDLGYMSPVVKEKIRDSDVLVLESNHDIQMLRVGKYPWNIKRRILGDLGHLSNDAAGEALCELLSPRTKRVYLAHLSRDHNQMDLAKLTVNNILAESGLSTPERPVRLMDTYWDRATEWDRIDVGGLGSAESEAAAAREDEATA
ncbi:MBL fold metallo-hydrolase [Paenibacillus thermotolerans]|uniref:MBL fold metallo-hydrolase n=1 Tax=Paenibacillus thermotolerans TaxID=3027807 RepID=UPI002368A00E|nr:MULTISPECIES: MBL fold metallo-hydrolase [unclassified Paenibacillus]